MMGLETKESIRIKKYFLVMSETGRLLTPTCPKEVFCCPLPQLLHSLILLGPLQHQPAVIQMCTEPQGLKGFL